MTINKLIESIKLFDYEVIERTTSSPIFGYDRTFNFTYQSKYPQGIQNKESFTLFEVEETNNDGVWYNEKNHLYYFFAFTGSATGSGNDIIVYRDDQLNDLFNDWYKELSTLVDIKELRDIRLNLILH